MPYSNPDNRRQLLRRLRATRQKQARDYLGGVCIICGTADNLEFHHRDPLVKEFTVPRGFSKSWDILVIELDKCELRGSTRNSEEI
jgi:hypothetical protein